MFCLFQEQLGVWPLCFMMQPWTQLKVRAAFYCRLLCVCVHKLGIELGCVLRYFFSEETYRFHAWVSHLHMVALTPQSHILTFTAASTPPARTCPQKDIGQSLCVQLLDEVQLSEQKLLLKWHTTSYCMFICSKVRGKGLLISFFLFMCLFVTANFGNIWPSSS